MKIITLEEHYLDPAVAMASAPSARQLSPDFAAAYHPSSGLSYSPSAAILENLGDARIADMDEHGISMQVLSCLTTQQVPADLAPALVRSANNKAAAAIRAHPDRFAAFAVLPTTAPGAAATELARCVDELGFVGTMINGRTDGEFLDAPRFDPVLAAAEARNVRRIQPVVATPCREAECTCSASTSAGVRHPSVLRGRLFSASATA